MVGGIPTRTVNVVQHHNPKYNTDKDLGLIDNHKHIYQVKKTTNTVVVKINDWITESQVQQLIDGGITVNITDTK